MPKEDLVNEVIEVNLAEEGGEFENRSLPVADVGIVIFVL